MTYCSQVLGGGLIRTLEAALRSSMTQVLERIIRKYNTTQLLNTHLYFIILTKNRDKGENPLSLSSRTDFFYPLTRICCSHMTGISSSPLPAPSSGSSNLGISRPSSPPYWIQLCPVPRTMGLHRRSGRLQPSLGTLGPSRSCRCTARLALPV
jgi:hypothetical protein